MKTYENILHLFKYTYTRRKNIFMSTYQVDSLIHISSFTWTKLMTQRRQKSRVGTSPSTSSTRSLIQRPTDTGTKVQVSNLSWGPCTWLLLKIEHIFAGTTTLKHRHTVSNLVLHSCICTLHSTWFGRFRGSFYYQKGDYGSNTNLLRGLWSWEWQSKGSRFWNTTAHLRTKR